jgi:type I restriction enzyme M protein
MITGVISWALFFTSTSEKQYLYANELLIGEEIADYKEVTDKET